VLDYSQRLSRFDPDSELTALNHDTRTEVPASPLLQAAVTAGLWAAERSGGLVDPTLVRELERVGYESSFDGIEPASLVRLKRRRCPRWRCCSAPKARGVCSLRMAARSSTHDGAVETVCLASGFSITPEYAGTIA